MKKVKRIARKMRDVTVSEVYSRPRISEKAEEMGLRKGTAFNLATGYDFRKKEDRQRCWRKLKEEKPDLYWWFAHHVVRSRTCRT